MEMNRNQYFFLAVFLVLLGMQLRLVQSFVLTPEATRFIAAREQATSDPFASMAGATPPLPTNLPPRVVSPPNWLGWCLISVGAVLFFHSMAMKRPGS